MAKKNGALNSGVEDKPTKISAIATDSSEKIKIFANRIVEKFNSNPQFYIQKVEFDLLTTFLFKESIYIVNEPDFTYKGVEYGVTKFNLINKHSEMYRLNKLFIFYDFYRDDSGDIIILGTYTQ